MADGGVGRARPKAELRLGSDNIGVYSAVDHLKVIQTILLLDNDYKMLPRRKYGNFMTKRFEIINDNG